MHSQEQLDLITKIYDLPLRPENWQDVLDEFAIVMNAYGCSASTIDTIFPVIQVNKNSSLIGKKKNDDGVLLVEQYNREIAHHDRPGIEKLISLNQRGFCSAYEISGIETMDDYLQHVPVKWNREQFGITHRAISLLNLQRGWFDAISIFYESVRGDITEAEKTTGSYFLDHFAKSIELGRAFGVLKNRFDGVLTALDRFHIGIFVLSPNGSVVVKNREADRILDASDGISLTRESQLHPVSDGEQRGKLKDAISQAVQTAQAQHDQAETLLTLPRRNGEDPYLVEVTPFRDHGEIESQFTGCLVFVIDPAKTDVVSTQGMQALYNLTGSESEVCKLLAQGLDTGEVAETRNLTTETVRSYVRQIFQKTGTNNRSQLVRLALTVNLPIDPGPDDE